MRHILHEKNPIPCATLLYNKPTPVPDVCDDVQLRALDEMLKLVAPFFMAESASPDVCAVHPRVVDSCVAHASPPVELQMCREFAVPEL